MRHDEGLQRVLRFGGVSDGLGVRFRRDLRVFRESVADGGHVNVRVVDPENGKHYSFSDSEYFLCEAADGNNSLQAIVDLYQRRFGRSISPREVRSFYRRLKIFGLTESAAATADDGEPVGPRGAGAAALDGGRLRGYRRGGGGGGGDNADDFADDFADDDGPSRPASGGRGSSRGGRLIGLLAQNDDAAQVLRALVQARAGQQRAGQRGDDGSAAKRPMSVWLGTPGWLYRLLYVLFFPVKYLTWLLWPGLVFAGLTIFHRWQDFGSSVISVAGSLSRLAEIIVSLFVVTLVARLVQGTVAARLTGQAPRLGVNLMFGFIPHFILGLRGVETLDKRGQLLVHATPMLARLSGFVIGTLVWAFYRHTHPGIAEAALLIGQVSLTHFLITALPVVLSDGYKWLATKLDEPRLRSKAMGAISAWLSGRPMPLRSGRLSATTLALFGVGVVLAIAALSLQILIVSGSALEAQFGGSGVAMFLALVCCNVVWLTAIYRRAGRAAVRPEGTDLALAGAEAAGRYGVPAERPRSDVVDYVAADDAGAGVYGRARLFWSCVLVAALAVAFLPYDYETGGPFSVLPAERQTVAVRASGEVVGIFVREGDWVQAGQVVAQLSAWDEERDLAVSQAALEKARAVLADLEARPKKEEVALAQRQVESSRASVAFSKAQADRAEYLFKAGSGSLQALQQAKTTLDQDVANLNIALASLDLVKSGATPAELDAARAEVRRLSHEVDFFRDQVERTNVRAPVAGRVITPNVELLSGKYLSTGQPFLDIEDTRVARVEIEVPETDMEQVDVGRTVRIKPWGYSDRLIVGEVTAVAPALEQRDLGEVLRVKAEIPNEQGELKTGMSGYAKIAGAEMPVWRAYLSLFARFFRVEVWSWIP